MQSFLRNTFAALVVCTLLTGASQAAIIYSQTTPEEPGAAFASSNIVDRQKVADNFLVEGKGRYTVRSLRVIGTPGALGDPAGPLPDDPQDNFRIVFLEDDSGSPGALVEAGDFLITTIAKRSPTGGRLLNGVGTPVEFTLDLGSGVMLDHGMEYWISVSNSPVPTGGWAWARASGEFDQIISTTTHDPMSGPWGIGNSRGGMWFELNSENIPEPSSTLIIIPIVTFAGCHCWLAGRRFVENVETVQNAFLGSPARGRPAVLSRLPA